MSNTIDQADIDKLQELTQTLESLEITKKRLTERRNSIIVRASRRTKAETRKSKRDIRVGDIVIVKDNYKGRQGIKGIVTEVYTTQLLLAPLDGSTSFRKYKENVRRIKP